MIPHCVDSMPSAVLVWLRLNFSPQKRVLPLGGEIWVESDGVQIVDMRLGKTQVLCWAPPAEQARYSEKGRASMEAMWPIDLDRMRLIGLGLERARASKVDGCVGPVVVTLELWGGGVQWV
jgi:hypothetical protein